MDPNQAPSPQVAPPSPIPVISMSRLPLILSGVIILLLVLLGVSFYQVLSLKKEVETLKTTALKPTPTPELTPTSVPTSSTNSPLEITGVIKFSNIEGGCWSIEPAQAKCSGDKCPLSEFPNYEIINIPAALKKDGIKASFKLEMQTDMATTCQLGPAVKILDYQLVK